MKTILSRKGFDSANGGIVSPIFDDGSLVSLPIPSNDADTYSDFSYDGMSYETILKDLHYKSGKWHCHADPDLDQERRNKPIEGWVPAFGQINSSASYLRNIGVKEGDVFLFFGNFHLVEKHDGKLRYVRRTGDFYKDRDIQVIWGYLQVGEILETAEDQEKLWWHPHAKGFRPSERTNIIFKATERLSFDPDKPGAGLLPFEKKRVLTLEGSSKATWKRNQVYDTGRICGNRRNSARHPETGIYYAGIWQELGLKESDKCIEWTKSIIK